MSRFLNLLLYACALHIVASSAALAQRAEPLRLDPPLSSTVAIYRDVDDVRKFYLLPLSVSLAKGSGGEDRLGIQYFKSDTTAGLWKAAITLSLDINLSSEELSEVKSALSRYDPTSITFVQARFITSYYRWKDPDKNPLVIVKKQEGNITLPTTLAFTFEVEGTAADLKAMLSGHEQELGIVLEMEPALEIATTSRVIVTGAGIARQFRKQKLLATSELELGRPAMELLADDSPTAGVLEDATARNWLLDLLGNAKMVRTGDSWLYGWKLDDDILLKRLETIPDVELLSVVNRTALQLLAAVEPLGDTCEMHAGAIVNLETGDTGCSGLD